MSQRKYKLLDLFCGVGGAAMGYHRAGFEIVGVDIKPQPNFPFEFIQADAIEFLQSADLSEFDVIHASPPCQGYSQYTAEVLKYPKHHQGKQTPKLIGEIRELIPEGMDYIIENVDGAKFDMISPFRLCGSMFNLKIKRHRYFESNRKFTPPRHINCIGLVKEYATDMGVNPRLLSVAGNGIGTETKPVWGEVMGIDWAKTRKELSEAIPPVYTEWIGRHMVVIG